MVMKAMEPGAHFENPPLVETVLGAQFERLEGLTVAHLGAYWRSLGVDWSNVVEAPELEQQFERFDGEGAWQGLRLEVVPMPRLRLQIRNAANDRMIQVQNGRFHYNWLGQGGGEYPHFAKVLPAFIKALDHFRSALGEFRLPALSVDQWEVTYVNHIPRGTVWSSPQDMLGILRGCPGAPGSDAVGDLETFEGRWHYEIPPQRGRLHVEANHGRLGGPDGREVLVLTFTARGTCGSDSLIEGLQAGHQAMLTKFLQMTSDRAREYWGERR